MREYLHERVRADKRAPVWADVRVGGEGGRIREADMHVRACVRVCVCVCTCAQGRVRVRVRTCACMHASMHARAWAGNGHSAQIFASLYLRWRDHHR